MLHSPWLPWTDDRSYPDVDLEWILSFLLCHPDPGVDPLPLPCHPDLGDEGHVTLVRRDVQYDNSVLPSNRTSCTGISCSRPQTQSLR